MALCIENTMRFCCCVVVHLGQLSRCRVRSWTEHTLRSWKALKITVLICENLSFNTERWSRTFIVLRFTWGGKAGLSLRRIKELVYEKSGNKVQNAVLMQKNTIRLTKTKIFSDLCRCLNQLLWGQLVLTLTNIPDVSQDLIGLMNPETHSNEHGYS